MDKYFFIFWIKFEIHDLKSQKSIKIEKSYQIVMIFTRAILYLSTLIKKIKCFLWKRIPNRSKLPAIHKKKITHQLDCCCSLGKQFISISHQHSVVINWPAAQWTDFSLFLDLIIEKCISEIVQKQRKKNTRQHTNIDWKINQSPLEGLWCDPWPRRNASISDVDLVKQLWSRAQHPKPRRNRTRCHFLLVLNKIEKKCNFFFLPFSIFQFVRNG